MENFCWLFNIIFGENFDFINLGIFVVVFLLLFCFLDKFFLIRSNNLDNLVIRWLNYLSVFECYLNVSFGFIVDRCWRGIYNWGYFYY